MNNAKCQHCGLLHGLRCPEVKAIEYFPGGTIKRVEYMTPADCVTPLSATYPTLNPPRRGEAIRGPNLSPCDITFGIAP